MADNVVEVLITGKDDTGAAYTSAAAEEKAFADLTDRNAKQFQRNWDSNRRAVLRGHDALLQAARAEMQIDREAEKLRKIEQDMSAGGGLFKRMLFGSSGGGWGSGGLSGALTGGESGASSILGSIGGAGGGSGWLGILGVAGALSSELSALAGGFAAAGAGAAAFYALSHNSLMQLQQDVGKLQSGQEAVQLAANMEKLYPSKAHLKALDAAKEKLRALTVGMGQDAGPAAKAMQAMGDEWHKLQAAFAPTAFKVLGEVFTIIKDAMPAILPLANAFAGALTPLLARLDSFVKSSGFHQWLAKFTSLIGPATAAIGNGLGRMVSDVGKFLTLFSGKDVAHAINMLFDTIDGVIRGVTWTIKTFRTTWDWVSARVVSNWHEMTGAFNQGARNIRQWISDAIGWFRRLPGDILHALGDFGHLLWNVGKSIIDGLINGIKSAMGGLGSFLGSIGSFIASHKGPIDVDRQLLFPHGQAMIQGLMEGIGSKVPALNSQLAGITRGISGLPAGGAYGGGIGGAPLRIQLEFTGGDGAIIEAFKQAIRVRGGGGTNSVQKALGQTW